MIWSPILNCLVHGEESVGFLQWLPHELQRAQKASEPGQTWQSATSHLGPSSSKILTRNWHGGFPRDFSSICPGKDRKSLELHLPWDFQDVGNRLSSAGPRPRCCVIFHLRYTHFGRKQIPNVYPKAMQQSRTRSTSKWWAFLGNACHYSQVNAYLI